MENANPPSTLGSFPQEPLDTTHAKFTARINKLLTMRQTIDSLLFKTINEMTNQSFDSEILYLEERIKELELRTQRRNNFEEELFRDSFPTEKELAYHKELLGEPQPPLSTLEPKIRKEDLGSIIDSGLSEVVLGKPFALTSKLTYDESLGLIRLYLMRRGLEVLRKFHCMILGGRFNQLSHVSFPLLSKPGEYGGCCDMVMVAAAAAAADGGGVVDDSAWRHTSGAYDDEASYSSRPKRTHATESVEEAMLGRVHYEILLWRNCIKTLRSRYNTNLARILPKQVYSPCIVDWGVLNVMGCGDVIEEMLDIKVYEMVGKDKIFTSEAWRCAFDISEPIYTELCHEFYATYEFKEKVTDEELMSKKLIKFRLFGRAHSLTIFEFPRRYDKVQRNELWLMSMFRARNHEGPLDTTTLRELIDSSGRLIIEDHAPGVPRVAIPRPPRPSIGDLYDMMGSMEIR
ncbi:hypothetical protein Tco_0129609 [Tanacetum coccineum]